MSLQAVFLDVDGVLVPIKNSWAYIHEKLGVIGEAHRHLELYLAGIISYEEWMYLDTELWIRASNGKLHKSILEQMYAEIPVSPDALRAVEKMRRRGLRIALLSGGVDLMVARVAAELGIDTWRANRLLFDEKGFLIPGGVREVEALGKDEAFLKLAEEIGVPPRMIAYVGDSHWDLPAFRVAGLGVLIWRNDGPPPTELVEAVDFIAGSLEEAADIVVEAGQQ